MGAKKSRERVGAEAVAFGLLLSEFAVLKRRGDISSYDAAVYESQLIDIPMAILELGKDLWFREGTGWYPTPPEWRQACEKVRLEMRAQMAFVPCEECATNPGWVLVVDLRGDKRLDRCQCWRAHQAKVQALGIPDKPLALPAASEFARVGEQE